MCLNWLGDREQVNLKSRNAHSKARGQWGPKESPGGLKWLSSSHLFGRQETILHGHLDHLGNLRFDLIGMKLVRRFQEELMLEWVLPRSGLIAVNTNTCVVQWLGEGPLHWSDGWSGRLWEAWLAVRVQKEKMTVQAINLDIPIDYDALSNGSLCRLRNSIRLEGLATHLGMLGWHERPNRIHLPIPVYQPPNVA